MKGEESSRGFCVFSRSRAGHRSAFSDAALQLGKQLGGSTSQEAWEWDMEGTLEAENFDGDSRSRVLLKEEHFEKYVLPKMSQQDQDALLRNELRNVTVDDNDAVFKGANLLTVVLRKAENKPGYYSFDDYDWPELVERTGMDIGENFALKYIGEDKSLHCPMVHCFKLANQKRKQDAEPSNTKKDGPKSKRPKEDTHDDPGSKRPKETLDLLKSFRP